MVTADRFRRSLKLSPQTQSAILLEQHHRLISSREIVSRQGDESRITTFTSHNTARELGVAEDRADRRVRRITAGGDPDEPVERSQACGIEDMPSITDEHLETRMEILGAQLIGITSGISRRHIHGTTEGDAKMRKIAAHSLALVGGLDRRTGFT